MKLDDFLPHLMVELPGMTDPLVKQTLRRLAIEFCQRSQVWQEVAEPILLVNGQSEYDLEAPIDAQVYLLLDVWTGMHPLIPVTVQRLSVELTQDQGSAEPTHYRVSADRQSLTVYPLPQGVTTGTTLQAKVCYVPKSLASTLPDVLSERYLMAVCAGVKASLMAMPGQPWSNPALTGYYKAQFDEGVVNAKIELQYDTAISGTITVAPRAFGF